MDAATDVAAAEPFALTPAEQAYLDSRGKNTEGLQQIEQPEAAAQSAVSEVKAEQVIDDPDAEDADQPLKEGEDGNKGRFVRHGAFHKERMLRKQLEAQLSEERQKFARVDERLKLLNEALSGKSGVGESQAQPPDPQADPFGYMQWQSQRIAELENKVNEPIKAVEQTRAESRIKEAYVADARRFLSQTPDFGDAYQFLMQGRDKELAAYGVSDPTERMAMIAAEEQNLVARAMQDGVSPSERLYRLAQARGYAKKASPAKEQQQIAPAKSSAEEKIEQINKAQAAAKSLSNIGGSPGAELTAAALAEMPADEFDRVISKLSPSKVRELLGG